MGTVRGRTLWAEGTAFLQMSLGRKQLTLCRTGRSLVCLNVVSEKVYGKK